MAAWLTVTFMLPPLLLTEPGCVMVQTVGLSLAAVRAIDGFCGVLVRLIATTPLLPITGAGLPPT